MSANTYLTPEERAVLESVRVGIAGAGGLGSNCAMHIVRAGVTHLTVVDFDVVNESNLNRQFFFRDQIGMKKVVEAFDVVDAKVMLVSEFAASGKMLVTASGLAGWGRSNAMRVKKMGNIVAVGDGETAVGADTAPVSPRVGIAAAMQANSVVALLLEKEL